MIYINLISLLLTQSVLNYSKSTMETIEQCVTSVHVINVVLASLLLTLNRFQTLFCHFHC